MSISTGHVYQDRSETRLGFEADGDETNLTMYIGFTTLETQSGRSINSGEEAIQVFNAMRGAIENAAANAYEAHSTVVKNEHFKGGYSVDDDIFVD